jgi:hypothetical protein
MQNNLSNFKYMRVTKKLTCMIPVISLLIMLAAGCRPAESDKRGLSRSKGEETWLTEHEFDPSQFKSPPAEFGPFTRWWWPGNDVTGEELKREIDLFAENGFAGVEIQPFTRGLNPDADENELNRVYSWDTPGYYQNLATVLEQAKSKGITVDLNGGSGWPSGGPHIPQEDNILNLGFSSVTVSGAGKAELKIPEPSMKHREVAMGGIPIKYAGIDRSLAKLQAVVAARIISEIPGEPVHLDPVSAIDISRHVTGMKLAWDVPPGNWKIIAFWSYPAGEIPVLIAKKDPGLVVDHLDSAKVIRNYEYLFGRRSGLEKYYGNPLRAIFNDSYEFKVDRHFSGDFLSIFRKNRGYDITPWLPANMQPGYNNHAESAYFPNQKPDFYFSDEDWRLQYDYDLTISDILQSQFFSPIRNWLEKRNMLHRTQPYGLHMDIIAAAGNASVPETEQLYSEGSEGFLKIISSGAHLYNRPVVTSESVVYRYRGEMTTPQKIRISVDKAFAAGVNQLIYHGTSYRYMTKDFSDAGWNAWDSPFTPNITYSSNIRETDNFWQDIREINQYIRRMQYVMRSGKPRSDVIIYFPFLGVESREIMSNPEELLPLGYFKGIEPESVIPAYGAPSREPAESTRWYHKIWDLVNFLESEGITWEFTNDQSIRDARMINGQINIRGNEYQALILPYVPYIQKTSALQIYDLCKKGARLLVIGPVPEKQPGFQDYNINDRKTKELLEKALKEKRSNRITDETALDGWSSGISRKINFSEKYRFVRQLHREMKDGSMIDFIWNKSDRYNKISFVADSRYRHIYWLDAENGTIEKADTDELSRILPPYGTIILYASVNSIPGDIQGGKQVTGYNGKKVLEITQWDIKAGNAIAKNTALFDWRSRDDFKYESGDGVYNASFNLDKEADTRYFIDLGAVYFTADILINGQKAGRRIYAPYELDVTALLKSGLNRIEIRVTPVQRNHSIGEALKGNPKFAQYRNLENTLMPAGLAGPVIVKAVK